MLNRLTLFLLSLMLAITQFLPGIASDLPLNDKSPDTVSAQADDDWPQLQHDPQRTGYAPTEVRPPYTYLWKWNQVPFASRTQPVVADNRLFIGGLDGIMYARNALTGAPIWSFSTEGPIRHSAAAYEGRVFFGSHDGNVYAIDAAQGSLAWQFQTGGGIATAPAVVNDTVYIGSTDGLFYALNSATGALRWSYDVGAPILTSAALSVDGSTAFFGAENITAYALNADNGSLRWSTHLQGQSLADRWPVVVGDTVIYRSQSLSYFHDLLHDGDDVMDQAGPLNPDWAADWALVRPHIISYLTTTPDAQTFFVLDAGNGNLRGPAPMLFTYGNGDPPGPPTVRGQEIYTLFRARHGIQQDSGSVHVTTRYDAALGQMNSSSLDIANLTLAPGEDWNLQYRATSDEPAMLSMAGSMLFVDTWTRLGGIDVDTGELFEVANVADDWPECNVQCVGRAGPMPFFDSYPFPGPRVGEGRVHRPAVIANGVIYWRVIEGGLAAIGHSASGQSQPYLWTDSGPAPRQLLEQPPAPTTGVQALSDYVWNEPVRPVPYPDAALVARLEQEVQAVVSAGHLAPFFLERGFTTKEGVPGDSSHPEDGLVKFSPSGNVYWFDPGEMVYTLSLAYPYLSSGLQSQVRAYLQTEMALYPPLDALPWPPDWRTDGTRRERYTVTNMPNVWPPPAPPLSTLYALWAYADATGDWAYLQNRWSQIDSLFDSKKSQVDSYAAISGAIGYARIAAHLGRNTEAQEGENVAVSAMTNGQNFSTFMQTANTRYPDPRTQTTGLRAPVFFGLVPEIGHYLRDTIGSTVTDYLNTLTDYYDGEYLWYLTRLGLQKEDGESSFHGPELAWAVYLALAFTQEIDRTELQRYLDRPWGTGDIYHLQKLVATIETGSLPNLNASTMWASNPIPASGEDITYTITLINSGNPFTDMVYLENPLPAGLTYIPNTISASLGSATYTSGAVHWNGVLADNPSVTITYRVLVQQAEKPAPIVNTATIDAGPYGALNRSFTVFVDGYGTYLPLILKRH
ncbi:MAG: PQQ-binding-like beta-propeller repeat protein [Chloroflexota bacterium]